MAKKTFVPPLRSGVDRERAVSDEDGGVIITALFPVGLEQGLKRIAKKRGMGFSELLRDIVTSNKQIMREIENTQPLRLEL